MDQKRLTKILKHSKRVLSNKDPVSLQVAITDYCFNECSMCKHWMRRNKVHMDFNVWTNFLRDRSELESVCYSGGDPMLYPYLNQLMLEHIDLGIEFGFICAGYIPKRISMDLLKKSRWVRISFDSVDDSDYSLQRGGNLNPKKIIKSIKRARSNGVNVEFTVTVTKNNANSIGKTLDFFRKEGMSGDVHPEYGESFNSLGVEDEIKIQVQLFSDKGKVLAPYVHGSVPFKKCASVFYQAFIDAFGNIFPCCTLGGDSEITSRSTRFGNIRYWDEYLDQRIKFYESGLLSVCRNCVTRFCEINSVVDGLDTQKKDFF